MKIRDYIGMLIGMAFWWPMLRNSVTGFVLGSQTPDGSLSQMLACAFLGATSFLCAVISFVCGAPVREGDAPALRESSWCGTIPHWRLLSIACLVSCAGASVMSALVVGSAGTWREAAQFAYSVLIAIAYVALPAAWSMLLLKTVLSGRVLFALVGFSYALSFAVGFLSYLPVPFNLVRPIGAPLISAVLWLQCWRWGMARGMASAGPEDDALAMCPPLRFGSSGRMETSLYVLTLIFFFVGSVATGFINTGSISYIPSSDTLIRDMLSLAVSVGLAVLLYATPQVGRAGFLLIAVLGILQFAGIFVATFLGESLFPYGTGLMQVSKSCFSLVLLLSVVVRMRGRDAKRGAAILAAWFVLPTVISSAISYLAVPMIVEALAITYEGFWGTLSLAMGFSLGVFLFVFLSSLTIKGMGDFGESVGEHGLSPDDLAQLIGEMYGLTAKERDVCSLLLGGNTYRKIAQLLGISDNTVQYHAKNIYRKLGVHTKQELVDLSKRL